jgi:hypothetical protein
MVHLNFKIFQLIKKESAIMVDIYQLTKHNPSCSKTALMINPISQRVTKSILEVAPSITVRSLVNKKYEIMQHKSLKAKLTLNMVDHKGLEDRLQLSLQVVSLKWKRKGEAHKLTMLIKITSRQIHIMIRG